MISSFSIRGACRRYSGGRQARRWRRNDGGRNGSPSTGRRSCSNSAGGAAPCSSGSASSPAGSAGRSSELNDELSRFCRNRREGRCQYNLTKAESHACACACIHLSLCGIHDSRPLITRIILLDGGFKSLTAAARFGLAAFRLTGGRSTY